MKKHSPLSYALFLLSRRDYSEHDMKAKLESRELTPEEVETVMTFLLEKKFLDDQRYATNLVRSEVNIKSYGQYRIKQKLMQKGVPEAIAAKALASIPEEDEREALDRLIKRWNSVQKEMDDKYKRRNKLIQHLINKGYDYHKIMSALGNIE